MDGVFVVVPAAVAVLFFEMATGYCVRFAVQQHLVMLDQTSTLMRAVAWHTLRVNDKIWCLGPDEQIYEIPQ